MKAKKMKQVFTPSASMLPADAQKDFVYLALLQLATKFSSELELPVDEVLLRFRLFCVDYPSEEVDEHIVYDAIKDYKTSIKHAFDDAKAEWGCE